MPLTAQDVVDALRAAIESGEYLPGHQLPSQAALREQFGVSAGTAQAAFTALAGEGLVFGRPGAGVFVRRPPQLVTLDALISGFADLEWGESAVPAWVAAALGVGAGAVVRRGHQVVDDRLFTEWTPHESESLPEPTRATRTMQARATAPDERQLLELRAGTPVLALHRVLYAADGRPVGADRLTAVGAAYTVDLGETPVH